MYNLLRKRMRFTKNQKGMTLIELMAVVVILGIVATVAGAAVISSFDKASEKTLTASERIIEDAAQRYILDNVTELTGASKDITITELAPYLNGDPVNPKTGEKLDKVTITGTLTTGYTVTVVWVVPTI